MRVAAATLFPAVVRAEVGLELAPEIDRHNGRGEPIVLRVIRYLPRGRSTIPFQRVVLTPGHSRETCARLMGGG